MNSRARAIFAPFLLTWLASCALPNPDAPQGDWRPAQDLSTIPERELLVTIPLAEPPQIAQVGKAIQADYELDFLAEWPIKTLDVHCFVFRLPDTADHNTNLSQIIARLQTDTRIDLVQPMRIFETLEESRPYNDTYLNLQHGLQTLQVTQGHRLATGKGIRVGVVDTGIDSEHPDLRDNMVLTKNFVGDQPADTIAEIHGTAIAGVIGAQANNRIGIVGVAPEVELVGLRGCWQDRRQIKGYCSSFTLARAINVAIQQKLDVLNLSLQGPNDPLLAQLLRVGVRKGMIVVAAYDYRQEKKGTFPASLPEVIAVATSDTAAAPQRNKPASAFAVLYAPGSDILTTTPYGSYNFNSGNSFAAAHVTGIVALMKERAPQLSFLQIAALLQASSQPVGTTRLGKVVDSATLQVNACTALTALVDTASEEFNC